MVSRRTVLGGLASGLVVPAIAGCAGRSRAPDTLSAYSAPAAPEFAPPPPLSAPAGLDAVIDISHSVDVSDFTLVRRQSNIHAVIHKASEGGDWFDPSYSQRRADAEAAGLLWGAYHFGTRQYSGAEQAQAFLAAARPGPATLLALDFEPNDGNRRNTMELAQAEAFVLTVQRATGRLPMVYVHPNWANGAPAGRYRVSLPQPITPSSLLARCELWLADYREVPEVPYAWADRGWRLWQYVADESPADAAYGSVPRAVAGVSHCDRNLFAGDTQALYRFWNRRA
jgi:lysozyme